MDSQIKIKENNLRLDNSLLSEEIIFKIKEAVYSIISKAVSEEDAKEKILSALGPKLQTYLQNLSIIATVNPDKSSNIVIPLPYILAFPPPPQTT